MIEDKPVGAHNVTNITNSASQLIIVLDLQ